MVVTVRREMGVVCRVKMFNWCTILLLFLFLEMKGTVCTPTPKEIRDPTTITVTTRESTVGSLGVASAGSILMHSLNVTQKHEKKTKKKKEKKHEKNRPKKKT